MKAVCVSIKAIVGCPLDLSQQFVERVHKLYGELGRENVRAVQESEDGERETADVETK